MRQNLTLRVLGVLRSLKRHQSTPRVTKPVTVRYYSISSHELVAELELPATVGLRLVRESIRELREQGHKITYQGSGWRYDG